MGEYSVVRRGAVYYVIKKSDPGYINGPYWVKSFAETVADTLNSR